MGLWLRTKTKTEDASSDDTVSLSHAISTVLLTGSTGNFGSYLLDHLINQQWTRHIYCLNRSSDARHRQIVSHKERGLGDDFGKVSFLAADFGDCRLGLEEKEYERLASTVDLVIHNAWPVDFNRNFRSFKPSIDGVQHLIDFCLSRKDRQVELLFVSSIGATSNWGSAAPSARSKIPEVELTDWKVARTGYGQSKLVAERLISHASRAFGLRAGIVRVGQLAGPVHHGDSNGKWTEREWLPSLIRSSITLKAIPRDLGPSEEVDWVPVDVAAIVLSDLSVHISTSRESQDGAQFFHLVNPSCTQWSKVVPTITSSLSTDVQIVSFVEWVQILKASSSTRGVDDGVNPAVKLLDFFDNLEDRARRFPKAKTTLLETKKTTKASNTLATLPSVSAEWMSIWMRQWGWDLSSATRDE